MAKTTSTQSLSRCTGRRIDVESIVAELLRQQEDADELALEEHALCRMIEANGMIGHDPELGMLV